MCNSVVSTSIVSCNHHHYPFSEFFHHPPQSSVPFNNNSPFRPPLPPNGPGQPTFYFLVPHMSGIIKYLLFCAWLSNISPSVNVGEGSGTPLQHSCLENPMNGRAWWAAVYGVAQSWTQLKRLSSSSSIDVSLLQHVSEHHSFLRLNYIPLYMYPFVCQWTFEWFLLLAIVSNAAMNTGIQIFCVHWCTNMFKSLLPVVRHL